MLAFAWNENKHIQLLLLTSRHCAYQRWHSHPSQRCHCQSQCEQIYFPDLVQLKDLPPSMYGQAKEMSYRNQHPTNQFLPLAIEIFGCLHKHADVFLPNCTNAIWSLKGP
jgi:hypothetical protein